MGESRVLWLESGPGPVLAAAAAALNQDQVVLFPTDTVYGLLARATSREGYGAIYRIKAREQAKPLQLLCAGGAVLARHAMALLAGQAQAQAQFAAGRITLVFDAGEIPGLPPALPELQPGPLGLRITRHAPLLELLELLGPPQLVWATSANASGQPPCSEAREAQSWVAVATPAPALAVLSRTPCAGQPSAVYRLDGGELRRLR